MAMNQTATNHRPVNGKGKTQHRMKRISAMSLPEKIKELRGGESNRVPQIIASIGPKELDTLSIARYSSSIRLCFDKEANLHLQQFGEAFLKGFTVTLKETPKSFFTPEHQRLLLETFCSADDIQKIIAVKTKKNKS